MPWVLVGFGRHVLVSRVPLWRGEFWRVTVLYGKACRGRRGEFWRVQDWCGEASYGEVGKAGMVRSDGQGKVSSVAVWQVWFVGALYGWHVEVSCGKAGEASWVMVCFGTFRHGSAGMDNTKVNTYFLPSFNMAGFGRYGWFRYAKASIGEVWQVWNTRKENLLNGL